MIKSIVLVYKLQRMTRIIQFSFLLLLFFSCKSSEPLISDGGKDKDNQNVYKNPVVNYSLPDPSIIRAADGNFYLYATEDIRNLPIRRSQSPGWH